MIFSTAQTPLNIYRRLPANTVENKHLLLFLRLYVLRILVQTNERVFLPANITHLFFFFFFLLLFTCCSLCSTNNVLFKPGQKTLSVFRAWCDGRSQRCPLGNEIKRKSFIKILSSQSKGRGGGTKNNPPPRTLLDLNGWAHSWGYRGSRQRFMDTSQPEIWHKPPLVLNGGEWLTGLEDNSEFAPLDHGLSVVSPKICSYSLQPPPQPGEGVLL